jgi:hypothetical protein
MLKDFVLTRMMKFALVCLLFLSGCVTQPTDQLASPYPLAAFSQNYVSVTVILQKDAQQNTYLLATFTPENGYHLYSKDLPRKGIYGEGRPTLLELVPESRIQAIGGLTTNAQVEVSDMGPDTLLVYPAGPLTLQQQIRLPPGSGWFYEQLSLTYESCSQSTCRTPVVGRLVPVRVPGAGLFVK